MHSHAVRPGHRVSLTDALAADTSGCPDEGRAKARTEHLRQQLSGLQERLYAEGKRSVLLVLQGIDTSGKDGAIRHVMSGVNPQGCLVTSFKAPTPIELAHDYLWRIHAACPPRGHIGIFNRSHYEDVLVTRVHSLITDDEATRRFEEIRSFESLLINNGTRIVKCFLHISRAEQQERLLERIDDPEKRWKVSPRDAVERGYWAQYRAVSEDAIAHTSTTQAPWVVVPSNRKWYRNLVVAECLVAALEDMHPQPSEPKGVDWAALRAQIAAD